VKSILFAVFLVLGMSYMAYRDASSIRELPREEAEKIRARASLIESGWVYYDHYPVLRNSLYLALYLDNKSEFIIRRIRVHAQLNWKGGKRISSISGDPCLTRNKSDDLRILVNDGESIQGIRPEQYQFCVVKIDFPDDVEEIARQICSHVEIDDTRWLRDVMKCNPFDYLFDIVEIKGHRKPFELLVRFQEMMAKVLKRRNS
jgi:hypothetical protein